MKLPNCRLLAQSAKKGFQHVVKPLKKVELKDGKNVRIEIKENLVERLRSYRTEVDRDILKEFIEERR